MKLNIEEVYNRLFTFSPKEKDTIKILEYNGYSKECLFKCSKCGKEFKAIPKTICQRHTSDICKFCYPYEKQSSLNIQQQVLNSINKNKDLDFIKFTYEARSKKDKHKRLKVYYKCKKCGEITDIFISDLSLDNIICQYCNLLGHRISLEVLKQRVKEKYDNKFIVLDTELKSKQNSLMIKCDCGFIFKTSISSLLRDRGRLCPKCQNGFSKTAVKIYKLLDKENIKFETEKHFQWLPKKWRYDFYLPEYNLIIEYMGEQHYHWTQFFHKTKNDFIKQQERDEIKKHLCLENQNNYLAIPYTEDKNIAHIIESISSSTTISKESRGKCFEVPDFL